MKELTGPPLERQVGNSEGSNQIAQRQKKIGPQSKARANRNGTSSEYSLLSGSTFLKSQTSETYAENVKRKSSVLWSDDGKRQNIAKTDKQRTATQPNAKINKNRVCFNYETLPRSVANFLRSQADRIRRSAASSVVNIGKDLLGAKRYLSHGVFLRWVEDEIGIPARTAQVYMQVAQWLGGKSTAVAHLPLSTLYVISAPSTPNDFAVDVLKRLQEGESISVKAVREELKAVRAKSKGNSSGNGVVELAESKVVTAEDDADRDSGSGKLGKEEVCGNRLLCKMASPAMGEIDETEMLDAAFVLAEAVGIMANGLSDADFIRVREIMTSNLVLKDPDLPQKLIQVFAMCSDQGNNLRSMPELSSNGCSVS